MSNQHTSKDITLYWESGTAYELFVSLYVLHKPELFGIRASWAAGIRSRIPAAERKLLEEVVPFTGFPLTWIHKLPGPKDAISALWALKQIPPAERMIRMINEEEKDSVWNKALMNVARKCAWDQDDLVILKDFLKEKGEAALDDKKIISLLARWAAPEELGEGFLTALQAYQQAFFEEEEKRLDPILKAGLERARQLAPKMSIEELLTELSQGVRLEDIYCCKNLVILPAFWTTPLVLYMKSDEDTMLFMFGVRPVDMSAIPGEMVPDGLLRALRALSDTSRLKILYYLSKEELTASELSRRLRLRAPTVTHHLSELRLSGLVNVTVKGQEKLYRTRDEALDSMYTALKAFLHMSKSEQ